MRTQAEFIHYFNDKHREQFNDELFARSEDDIIEEIKKVILSCQRNKGFIIRVDKFTVIEDYSQIYKILYDFEAQRLKNKNPDENRYSYLSLKDSDVKLLIVDYFIAVNNPEKFESKNIQVLIEVPRIVDKYYFRIYGNKYASTFQIVESTYNNSSSNSKIPTVTLKTIFMASRFYRFNIHDPRDGSSKMKTIDGIPLRGVFYNSRIFNKSVHVMKYLLAKFGLIKLQEKMMVPFLVVTDTAPSFEDYYIVKKHNIYISIPKYIYDNDHVAQSLVYTMFCCIDKNTTSAEMYTISFWLKCLGKCFSNETEEKGRSILESLEGIYDISSQEHLHLPDHQKRDIYDVIIWIIREFSALRIKDNLDITMKRYRCPDYIAALYATRQSKGLFRLSDKGNRITLKAIEKAIVSYPDYLLKVITQDRLINYANNVNDLDAINALKFSYKGCSGLGEEGTAIPQKYRQCHKSHIGRLDLDSSSASDPGLSGTICPMADIHNGSFSNKPEPNNWRLETDNMLQEYIKLQGIQQAFKFKRSIGITDTDVDIDVVDGTLESMGELIKPVLKLEYDDKIQQDMADQIDAMTE